MVLLTFRKKSEVFAPHTLVAVGGENEFSRLLERPRSLID